MPGNFRCTGACRSCRLLLVCLADLMRCLGSCDAPVIKQHPCTCGDDQYGRVCVAGSEVYSEKGTGKFERMEAHTWG
jgi:hypothetical protein